MPEETRNNGFAVMRAYESVRRAKGERDAMFASLKGTYLNSTVQENHI